MTTPIPEVTPCEHAVWTAIASGQSRKEVAFLRGVSVKTVDMQLGSLRAKLRARNMTDITRAAVRHGVITVEVLP